jgi:DNA-binding transcriptional MerR regulator
MKLYNIQMAAKISGLSAHTIRAWEKRYQAIVPDRSDTGRRQYSDANVDRLTLLAKLTQIGNSIGQIANLSDQELREILQRLTNQKMIPKSSLISNSQIAPEEIIEELFKNLKDYHLGKIATNIELAKNNLKQKDLALKILAPVFKELTLGRKHGSFNDSQFQALRAILSFHVGELIFGHYQNKSQSKNKIILSTPDGELTPFEIMNSALLCAHYNLNYYYLSTNLPALSTLEAINATNANLLILGINDSKSLSSKLEHFIEEIVYTPGNEFKLWIVSHEAHEISRILSNIKGISYFSDYQLLDSALANLK